jgi:hypothetical protein
MRGILIVLTLVLVALVAPVKSYAQADLIVMACTWDNNPALRMTITLDLTRKTVSQQSEDTINHIIFPVDLGTIAQITDQKVIWVRSANNAVYTHTLDRYTGHLSVSPAVAQGAGEYTCQKTQKQI